MNCRHVSEVPLFRHRSGYPVSLKEISRQIKLQMPNPLNGMSDRQKAALAALLRIQPSP
ncbi:MAG: hypothetical protein ACYCW6_18280 [Candidatus Xenobia bacterium]